MFHHYLAGTYRYTDTYSNTIVHENLLPVNSQ